MSMSFVGGPGDYGEIPEEMEVNMPNGNTVRVLRALGYLVRDSYFVADIDEFIGVLLVADISSLDEDTQAYVRLRVRRLLALASFLKAQGATKIYAA